LLRRLWLQVVKHLTTTSLDRNQLELTYFNSKTPQQNVPGLSRLAYQVLKLQLLVAVEPRVPSTWEAVEAARSNTQVTFLSHQHNLSQLELG
jgi:hypothetical protein